MNKLTAEKCRMAIESIKMRQASIREEIYLQALEVALPVLEQQEKGNDGWIEWSGGDCPVELPRQEVEYRTRLGNKYMTAAGDLRWFHEGKGGDIIAYRTTPEQPTNQNGEQ